MPDPHDRSSPAADVLVLLAHPQLEHSRANRAMADAARAAAAAQPGRIALRDLYALYPDYAIDVEAEQAALQGARLVVWQHPLHWYHMPPLMQLWVDEVFAFGWAYGPGGTRLRGKDLWLAVSTGGPQHSYQTSGYNRYFFDAFLPPYEQTATLCGLRFVPPLVLHGAHRADDATIAAHARIYGERLASYPDWPELEQLPQCVQAEVPASARPALDDEAKAA